MDLHEPLPGHDHASTSLKTLLLIFAGVLVLALGYFVFVSNNTADTTENTTPKVKKTDQDKTTTQATPAATAVACGDSAYAFHLTFGALWTGYKIKEVTPTDAIVTCYINMPTTSTDTVWTTASTTNFAHYSSLFAVSVYTPAQFTAASADPNPPTKLGQNANYVWAWAPAQAYPDDLTAVAADVKNVVASFSL